jgi:hypothetical protein
MPATDTFSAPPILAWREAYSQRRRRAILYWTRRFMLCTHTVTHAAMSGMKEDGGSGDGERTKVAGGQNGFGFNDFHRVKARKYISMCNRW